ncbi:hypothetical protein RSSM_04466 [Rhodopirellula sallentina SM41]|uniref:Uncharacterized protein n=1 Tax=Rhodopirellula sallentina SM41 TaxID=1263870 RepID=M5U898_9BACT|nr:hypothetical protein RSSM_04466 [Rhodopirellula sallentina SM41]
MRQSEAHYQYQKGVEARPACRPQTPDPWKPSALASCAATRLLGELERKRIESSFYEKSVHQSWARWDIFR